MQLEGGEDEGERVEARAHEYEGVRGGIGQEVRIAEGANELVQRERVKVDIGELGQQLLGSTGEHHAAKVGQMVAPAVDEAIGAARGRGGLDAAAIAPRAVTGVVPKEAGGDHRAVLAQVAGVALAHPAHAVATAAG